MTEQKHQVRDGDRTLEFSGDLLAESTSQRPRQSRWIEFKLYRTAAGSYVLSRVGCSVVFHRTGCSLVQQYRLKPGDVRPDATPCDACNPSYESPVELFPEKIRYWAQVMTEPAGVLEALYKIDPDGTRYLTLVAQRLLASAAYADERIADAYQVEHVA